MKITSNIIYATYILLLHVLIDILYFSIFDKYNVKSIAPSGEKSSLLHTECGVCVCVCVCVRVYVRARDIERQTNAYKCSMMN